MDIGVYELAVLALGGIGLGILLLIKGGDWTIDAAQYVAAESGMSKMFIAATIVAFGTSAPELFTSINANLQGYPGISLGNVLGSNIANVLMVLGIAAVLAPVLINRAMARVDTLVMIGATAVLAVGIYLGAFSRLAGLLMFGGLIVYVCYQYFSNKLDDDADEEVPEFDGMTKACLTLGLGLGALVLGSELLVQGAIAGGKALGVREAVIGMTVVAFGTSLPELSTCVAAARRGQSDFIIGNLVGSNIFNILSIVALTAAIKPLAADPAFLGFDLPAVLAVTAVFAFFLLFMQKAGKLAGGAFVCAYLLFISYQYKDILLGAF